jgi:hypothetical protein
MEPTRKKALFSLSAVVVALSVSIGTYLVLRPLGHDGASRSCVGPPGGLSFQGDLLWGEPNRGMFPATNFPRYVDPLTADAFLRDDDRVYFFRSGKSCYAYPEVLLTTYHVVNDLIDEQPLAITYCMLAGSACRFSRRVGDRILTFGVTGQLYGGNSVLFDQETETDWLQMNGEPLRGPLHGSARLGLEPLECRPWKALRREEGVKVLPAVGDIGEFRQFQKDMEAEGLGMKVAESARKLDPRLLPYTKGMGIRAGGAARFYPRETIIQRKVINDVVGEWTILVYRGADDQTHIFRRSCCGGRQLDFFLDGVALKDQQTGSTWSDEGICREGPLAGSRLEVPFYTRVYWFAWSSVYPETGLI